MQHRPDVAEREPSLDGKDGNEAVQGRACDTPAAGRGVSQAHIGQAPPDTRTRDGAALALVGAT